MAILNYRRVNIKFRRWDWHFEHHSLGFRPTMRICENIFFGVHLVIFNGKLSYFLGVPWLQIVDRDIMRDQTWAMQRGTWIVKTPSEVILDYGYLG